MPAVDPLDLRPIARLRRCAAALQAGRLPAPEDRAWFVSGMRRYEATCLAGAAIDLGQALGLGRHGARGWWSNEARDRRDRLLIELRTMHFAALDDKAAAAAIARLAGVVAARPGRTRARVNHGAPAEMMAAILQAGQPMPGPRHLRRLLGSVAMKERLSYP